MKVDSMMPWIGFGVQDAREYKTPILIIPFHELPSSRVLSRFNRRFAKSNIASVVVQFYWRTQKRQNENSRDSYNTAMQLRTREGSDLILEIGLLRSTLVNKYLKVAIVPKFHHMSKKYCNGCKMS